MEAHHKPIYRTFTVLTSLALALAVARCSPLSLSKSKLKGGSTGAAAPVDGVPANPTEVSPIGQSSGGVNAGGPAALINVKAAVLELSDYQSKVDELPESQRLNLTIEKDRETLEAFKQSRTMTLRFDGSTPDECKAFLGLSMSGTDISKHGWNATTAQISTDCAPDAEAGNGLWRLTVSESVSAAQWSLLAESIQAVTIYVSNHPHLSVAKTTSGGVKVSPK